MVRPKMFHAILLLLVIVWIFCQILTRRFQNIKPHQAIALTNTTPDTAAIQPAFLRAVSGLRPSFLSADSVMVTGECGRAILGSAMFFCFALFAPFDAVGEQLPDEAMHVGLGAANATVCPATEGFIAWPARALLPLRAGR